MALTDVYGDIWGDCWNGDIWGRAPVEALPVNYYTQFYYMLLQGTNPYDVYDEYGAREPFEYWLASRGVAYHAAPNQLTPATWTGQTRGINFVHSDNFYGTRLTDSAAQVNNRAAINFALSSGLEYFDANNAASEWKFLHDGTTDWTIALPFYVTDTTSGRVLDTSVEQTGAGLHWFYRTDRRFDIYVFTAAGTHRNRFLGNIGDVPDATSLICLLSYSTATDSLTLRVNGTQTTQLLSGPPSTGDPAGTLRLNEDNPTPKMIVPLVFISKRLYTGADLTSFESYLTSQFIPA